jgi:hypothetical protein
MAVVINTSFLNNSLKKLQNEFCSSLSKFRNFDFSVKGVTRFLVKQTTKSLINKFVPKEAQNVLSNITSTIKSFLNEGKTSFNEVFSFLNHMFGFGPESFDHNKLNKFLLKDPYHTGFFYVVLRFPRLLQDYVSDMGHKLGFLCKEVNAIDLTLNTTEKPGLGQTKSFIPINLDYARQLNMIFYDIHNLAVQQLFKAWVLLPIDLKTGLHLYETLSDIKGSAIVIHMSPRFKQVTAEAYLGLMATQVSTVSQSRDIALREVPVTFTFDLYVPSAKNNEQF